MFPILIRNKLHLLVMCVGMLLPVTVLACSAPEPVCAWKDRVVGIRTPSMIASGITLESGFIVTNMHVAEDHASVVIRDSKGSIFKAQPMAHDMPADLAILRPEGLTSLVDATVFVGIGQPSELYVVGFDQGRNGPRVYRAGNFAHYPDTKVNLQARIHTNSKALPGNSGGAVVDADGTLIGILASGDGKISEVIPAVHISEVVRRTDVQHADAFAARGRAIRVCADTLYFAGDIQRNPPPPLVDKIERNCTASGNKQLFDQAGQLFGKWWMFDRSEQFLKLSESLDPNSPNTLMSLAVTYHLDRQAEKERPILERYLALDPSNAQALRLGIQVAGMLQDREFADYVLGLMKQHNPASVSMAQSFIDQAFGD